MKDETVMAQRWNILVIWADGSDELLMQGDRPAVFTSRRKADEHVEFMKMGMDDGDVRGINAVPAKRYAVENRPDRFEVE